MCRRLQTHTKLASLIGLRSKEIGRDLALRRCATDARRYLVQHASIRWSRSTEDCVAYGAQEVATILAACACMTDTSPRVNRPGCLWIFRTDSFVETAN